jgi:hypothetical protein
VLEPLLALLLLQAASPPGIVSLSVREDPVQQGHLLVGVTPETRSLPIDVTWYPPNGVKPISYRSPGPSGFEVCAFLESTGASRVKGPHEVVVRRGDAATRIRIDYDGRSCAGKRPTRTGSRTKGSGIELPTPPSMPVPVVVLGPQAAEARPSEAEISRASMTVDAKWVVFRVQFDRPLTVEPGTRATVTKLVRLHTGKAVIRSRASFQVRRTDPRAVEWRVSSSLVPFDPALAPDERLRMSFVIDDREFEDAIVSVGGES